MISTIRVIRIAQIYRMTRHLPDLQILVETMKASVAELKLWLGTFILVSILFATLIYYAERKDRSLYKTDSSILFRILDNPTNDFISIPSSIWWAVVTMCTVGYGDMVPKTPLGMFVGALCGIAGEKNLTVSVIPFLPAGVITISLPVPFLVSTFEMYYSHRQVSTKHQSSLLSTFTRQEQRCQRNAGGSSKFVKFGKMLIITKRNKMIYSPDRKLARGSLTADMSLTMRVYVYVSQ